MEKGMKIFLGITGLAIVIGIIYKYNGVNIKKISNKTPDDLKVEFSNFIDDDASMRLYRNGKLWTSGRLKWNGDLVGKQGSDKISDGKNTFSTRHLNGKKAYIYLESLDKKYPVGIIDFNEKTYKLA